VVEEALIVARYRNGIILLVFFVILLAVVLLTQGSNNNTTTTTAATTATPDPKAQQLQIFNIPSADTPTKIEVKQTDPAKSVAFKYENNKWLLDSSAATELDTIVVSSTIGQFNNLKGTTLVTDKGDNLANYGLDKPSLLINLNSPTQGAKVLNVGQQNPATKAYYVKLDNDLRVWAVAPTLIEQVKGWLTQLPIPVPTPTPFPDIALSPLPSPVLTSTLNSSPVPTGTITTAPVTTTVPAGATTAVTTTTVLTGTIATTALPTSNATPIIGLSPAPAGTTAAATPTLAATPSVKP
jgi:hypothetical protein